MTTFRNVARRLNATPIELACTLGVLLFGGLVVANGVAWHVPFLSWFLWAGLLACCPWFGRWSNRVHGFDQDTPPREDR